MALRPTFTVKTFTRITAEQDAGIAAIIDKRGGPKKCDASEVIRAALDEYLDRHLSKGERPPPKQTAHPLLAAPAKRTAKPARKARRAGGGK